MDSSAPASSSASALPSNSNAPSAPSSIANNNNNNTHISSPRLSTLLASSSPGSRPNLPSLSSQVPGRPSSASGSSAPNNPSGGAGLFGSGVILGGDGYPSGAGYGNGSGDHPNKRSRITLPGEEEERYGQPGAVAGGKKGKCGEGLEKLTRGRERELTSVSHEQDPHRRTLRPSWEVSRITRPLPLVEEPTLPLHLPRRRGRGEHLREGRIGLRRALLRLFCGSGNESESESETGRGRGRGREIARWSGRESGRGSTRSIVVKSGNGIGTTLRRRGGTRRTTLGVGETRSIRRVWQRI